MDNNPNYVPLADAEVTDTKYMIADGLTTLSGCADALGVRVTDMAVGVRRIDEDRAHYKAQNADLLRTLQLATDANAALVAQQPSADNLAQATAAVAMWSKASTLDEAGRACALQLAAALQEGQHYEREAAQLRSFVISLYNEANQKPPFIASQSTINRLLKEHRITVRLDTPRVPRAAGLPAGPVDPPTPGIERHFAPRRSGPDGVTPSPQNIDGRG